MSLVDVLVVPIATRVMREVFEAARATTEADCLVVNAATTNTVDAVEHSVANFVVCVANFLNSRKMSVGEQRAG